MVHESTHLEVCEFVSMEKQAINFHLQYVYGPHFLLFSHAMLDEYGQVIDNQLEKINDYCQEIMDTNRSFVSYY